MRRPNAAPRPARKWRSAVGTGVASSCESIAVPGASWAISLTLPIRLESEANRREHWTARAKRTAQQRTVVRLHGGWFVALLPKETATVTLTRVAPREYDDDNLRGAFKAVRDQVGDELGLPNDRDPRVTWRYCQRRGKPKEYAVIVAIEARAE